MEGHETLLPLNIKDCCYIKYLEMESQVSKLVKKENLKQIDFLSRVAFVLREIPVLIKAAQTAGDLEQLYPTFFIFGLVSNCFQISGIRQIRGTQF